MPVNSFTDFPMSWKPNRADLEAGPVYLALAARLEADIASGVLPAGTKLPPQRELADWLDLNFTTVTRAYDVCREKGLVYGVVGRGTFVAEAGRSVVADGVIDCSVVQAFADKGASFVAEAARKVLSRSSVDRLFSYASRDGWPHQREAGVRWLARAGLAVPPERVSVFPGVQSALSTALLALFRPGDALAVDRYTYANLIHLARLAHVRLVAVEGDAGGMQPKALARIVQEDRKVKGVFLMPCCANPTTITLSERRKDALAAVAREAGLIVLEDDVGIHPQRAGGRTFFARFPEQTVYLAGSVRLIAPGLRVTYVAYPGRFAERMQNGLHHLAIKASALEAEILSELVLSGAAERVLELKARKAKAANAVFDEVFGSDGGDETRFFRTVPCPNSAGRGGEIEARLAATGVKVCHSDRFAVRKTDPASFLRVSVSSVDNLKILRKGLSLIDSVGRACFLL